MEIARVLKDLTADVEAMDRAYLLTGAKKAPILTLKAAALQALDEQAAAKKTWADAERADPKAAAWKTHPLFR